MPYFPEPRDNRNPWDAPTDPVPPKLVSRASNSMPPLPSAQPPNRAARPTDTPPHTASTHEVPSRSIRPAAPTPVRRMRGKRIVVATVLALLAVTLVAAGVAAHRLYDFGSAISNQAPLSSSTGFMSGIGRVNVLVLGYGGAGHDGAYLTDSMMVMSLNPGDSATTLISVPRDLWVQVPPQSGQYQKLNTAYQDGLTNGYNGMPAGALAGGAEASQKVSDLLGITVSYWLTIDFSGFRDLVDALGGVDITVPTAFTARYPANDDPKIDASWKVIHFTTGRQHMTGEQAIEYARARYVLNPVSEGSDFARSARQQLLIRAILNRARQVSAWPGITRATDALQKAMYTNMSLADLLLFAQKMDFTHAAHIGLTDQNVLVDAQSNDGQDILLPVNGDWNAIKRYVSDNVKS